MRIRYTPKHMKQARPAAPAGRFANPLMDWAGSFVRTLPVLFFLLLFVVRVTVVSGQSMEPTLHDHEVMLVSCLQAAPARGDIVVLNKKSFADAYGYGTIVKRVIAVGGDTVDIDFAAGEVFVNEELLDEPYISEPTWTPEGMRFPLTVPQGSVFVLGDNRNASTDSRDPDLGLVDTRYIIGRALGVLFPFDQARMLI